MDGKVSTADCPGPPASRKSGSGAGFFFTAGITTRLRAIWRPCGLSGFSGTSSEPQRALICVLALTCRTQSESVRPGDAIVAAGSCGVQAEKSRLASRMSKRVRCIKSRGMRGWLETARPFYQWQSFFGSDYPMNRVYNELLELTPKWWESRST